MKEPVDIKKVMERRGIAFVIPVFNNRSTILEVIDGAREYCRDIIVVNDGSTDGTGELLEKVPDITLVSYGKNHGKGYALKRGISTARNMGFSYVISMDADLQHLPSEIPALVNAGIRHPGLVIIGKRKDLGNVERTKGSSFANKFSNFWFCFQTWRHISDTQSGFRLYPIKKIWWLPLLTSRYEAELEILVLYAWSGVKIKEVPVEVFYPERDKRCSSFRPVADFTRISIMNTALSLLAVIIGWPLTVIRIALLLIRSLIVYLIYIFFTLLVMTPVALYFVIRGKHDDSSKDSLRWLLNISGKLLSVYGLFPGVSVTYENKENETFEKPAVILSNHQSGFDLLVILALSAKLIVLTNDRVWNNPYYGYVIRHADYFRVSEGLESIGPKLQRLFNRGISTVVFPEGTRSRDCTIGRFHSGAFAIADALGADIIPIVLHGTQKVFQIDSHLMHRGNIHVEIGRRIPHEEYMAIEAAKATEAAGSYRDIASHYRRYYRERYEEIRDREDRNA